jgi:hypothetical protein
MLRASLDVSNSADYRLCPRSRAAGQSDLRSFGVAYKRRYCGVWKEEGRPLEFYRAVLHIPAPNGWARVVGCKLEGWEDGWALWDSNPGPTDYESAALTV